jgi:hypothetical protein
LKKDISLKHNVHLLYRSVSHLLRQVTASRTQIREKTLVSLIYLRLVTVAQTLPSLAAGMRGRRIGNLAKI